MFDQYKGLRKEVYVLFIGRIITNMGALIWPMLTLILSNKMQMPAGEIAGLFVVFTIISLPITLLGGKLADRYNKRNIILFCNGITTVSYLLCGILPLSMVSIYLFFMAGAFGSMSWPAFDALVADLTLSKDRERAFSLEYLGANIGLVLAPTIGGLLFANHLNLAFLINSFSTFLSSLLIFNFIKDVTRIKDHSVAGLYETSEQHHTSIFTILSDRKLLLYYISLIAVMGVVYAQFNFLIPLNLEQLYGAQGAIIFGTITSVNCLVVIFGTPLMTTWFKNMRDVRKILWGEIFISLGLGMYIFIQGNIPFYYLSIVIFTIGEVFETLGKQPYISRRVPASHRGRVASFSMIFGQLIGAFSQRGIGWIIDQQGVVFTWYVIMVIGIVCIGGLLLLGLWDRKTYSLLYEQSLLKVEDAANE
jgi:MFS family permease